MKKKSCQIDWRPWFLKKNQEHMNFLRKFGIKNFQDLGLFLKSFIDYDMLASRNEITKDIPKRNWVVRIRKTRFQMDPNNVLFLEEDPDFLLNNINEIKKLQEIIEDAFKSAEFQAFLLEKNAQICIYYPEEWINELTKPYFQTQKAFRVFVPSLSIEEIALLNEEQYEKNK